MTHCNQAQALNYSQKVPVPFGLGAVSRAETRPVPAAHSQAGDGEHVWPPAGQDRAPPTRLGTVRPAGHIRPTESCGPALPRH